MNDQNAQMDYLVGIDTGGTFTDIVLTKAATGDIQVTEVSSTPENPAIALVEGIHVILSRTKVDEEELAAIIDRDLTHLPKLDVARIKLRGSYFR